MYKHFKLSLAMTMLVSSAITFSSAVAHSTVTPLATHHGKALAAGIYHLELIVADNRVQLYVYDRGNNAAYVDGLQVKALVWTAKDSQEVALTPVRLNLMGGTGTFAAADIQRVIVMLAEEGGAPVNAWFKFSSSPEQP
ncbi:MAG: hypothetical protein E6R07_07490 [Nevskiaceae bacterium]|nr:MAG: hypothetical protein E6R07_07490 [Nevskiaceae bacterium]